MSDFNAKILNVVPTSGNNGMAAANLTELDVPDNTLAYMDLETGLSTTSFNKRGYFLFKYGDDFIRTLSITPDKITAKKHITPVTEQGKAVIISGFENVKCCKDLTIRFNLRNQAILRITNTSSFTIPAFYANCKDCSDPNKIVKNIMDEINRNPFNFLKATPVSYDSTSNSWNEITDWDTFYSTNHTVNTDGDDTNDVVAGLKVESNLLDLNNACNAFNVYYNPAIGDFDVIIDSCRECQNSGGLTVETIQEPVVGVGKGTNLLFLEGLANGWQGRRPVVPYSNIAHGMVNGKPSRINPSGTYDIFIIEGSNFYPPSQGDYTEHWYTINIPVPSTDTATITAITAFLGL